MKVSEYIKELESFQKQHGDLEVELTNVCYDRVEVKTPILAYRKILSKREYKPSFWRDWNEKEKDQKGEAVCRLN